MELASVTMRPLLRPVRPLRTVQAPPPPSMSSLGQAFAASRVMHDLFAVVSRLAPTDVTVTLTGETGTGKDVFAHLIHDTSRRAEEPFVVFDCGAVPANLVESELFGHERGAFTGAHAEHPGAFERAAGGTLFLDEIGELPLELQPRLLRALDNRSVRRVGGTKDRQIDVRIVAATNRDLGALVAGRQFRQDLYFRLAAAIVNLPPLRERLDDVAILASRLLEDLGRGEVVVAEATLTALRERSWPGNVRELKNVLACALAFVEPGTGLLEPRHLRFIDPPTDEAALDRLPLGGHALGLLERAAIRQTLIAARGNKAHAARTLGIAPSTLYEKLKKYGL
jgi:transcriptional regulator with PAS, ATPase and Fis domain